MAITRSKTTKISNDASAYIASNGTQRHSQPISPVELETMSSTVSESLDSTTPVYTIDLSLPPAQRYVEVAKEYQTVIDDLTNLFDELLEDAKLPKRLFHLISRTILRRLYSKEQTEEIKGISKVTGVPMYLLVAYNILLDLFMGCTSGGVLVKEPGRRGVKRMMQFRCLDWGMSSLRQAIVQFDYKERPDGEVIARTVGYVGYVGVLTGVRQGLSVSSNFRPYHNNDKSKYANIKFYGHLLTVLLGLRPSISSHLRDFILPRTRKNAKKWKAKEKDDVSDHSILPLPTHTIDDIARGFPSVPTTAAYFTFTSPTQTLILEKDRITAKPLLSSTFLAVTNHDSSYESISSSNSSNEAQETHAAHARTHKWGIGMEDILAESMDRKGSIVAKWERWCRKGAHRREQGVGLDLLKEWLLEYPVVNEETHFVCVMDPGKGMFRWVKAFEEDEVDAEVSMVRRDG